MVDLSAPLILAAPLWLAGLAVVKCNEHLFKGSKNVPSWVTVSSYVKFCRDSSKTANRRNARLVISAAHHWFEGTNSPSPGGIWEDRCYQEAKLSAWAVWLLNLDAQKGMAMLQEAIGSIPKDLFAKVPR